ncbi:MAG: hypothetical protein KGM98_06455 [Bacteroidota bacterium]|nr:hypothetical protein [Bacteroidota bacterium]
MKGVLAILLWLLASGTAQAQPSDLLVLKKHERTIQSFFPGDEMNFYTADHNYFGFIRSIRKDSVFLVQYDIRQVFTGLGVYILDTVAAYNFAVNYKEITGIGKLRKNGFDWTGSGGALLGGGILLMAAGLGTWVFTKPNTQYYASPYLVGGAALLAGIGYLMVKAKGKGKVLGKKYTLEYIKVK